MSSADATAFAVILPNGDITWYPLRAEQEVESLVAGKYAGAVDHVFLIPGEPLRLIASDIALAAPDDFPPNPAAQRIITALSRGRITQEWRGHVAIAEYEQDTETREWLWPGVMSEQVQQRIRQAATERFLVYGRERLEEVLAVLIDDGADLEVLGGLELALMALAMYHGSTETITLNPADVVEIIDEPEPDCTCPPGLVERGGFRSGCPVHARRPAAP